MYVENKSGGLNGEGRIGWVEFSKSGQTFRYRGRSLLKVTGYKCNCFDLESPEHYWVSGPHKDGADKLQIDEDARVEYWTKVREEPGSVHLAEYRAGASTRTGGRTRKLRAKARSK